MAGTKSNNKDNSKRNRFLSVLLALVLALIGFAVAYPPTTSIHKGLDIQGGLSVVLSATSNSDTPVTQEQMEIAKSVVENRINMLGASEATVNITGTNSDQLLVQIPGLSDSTEALNIIGSTGVLEFARLDSFTDETVQSDIDSGNIIDYSSADTPEGETPVGGDLLSAGNIDDYKHITVEEGTYEPIFTGDHITNVTVGRENDTSSFYAVNITLDSEASSKWAAVTTELAPTNGKIVILLDGEVNSAPAVQSAITGGQTSITGNYTLEQAKSLETILNSGSLPVSFTYDQAQTVGPTLGQGEFESAVWAMLLGLLVVILYLFIFYRGMAIIPTISMILFACIYLGIFAVMSFLNLFSMSLAGLAGIILTLGLAFDSYVLCVEKLKEELKEGKTLKSASNSALKHAMITSIDANVVSIISALALFFLASSAVKGFGLTLSIGIICNMVVLVLFIVPIMRLLAPKTMLAHPAFWDVKYSLELGDVRHGTTNYKTPAEITEMKKKDKEKKEVAKERKQAKKLNDKQSAKRAKEIKTERKAEQKEKLEQLKAEDRQRDEERKAAKKAQKSEKEIEKQETEELQREEKEEVQEMLEEEKQSDEQAESVADVEVLNEEQENYNDSDNDEKTADDDTHEQTAKEEAVEAEPKSASEIAQLVTESLSFEVPDTVLPKTTDEDNVILTSGNIDSENIKEEVEEVVEAEENFVAEVEQEVTTQRMNRAQRRAAQRKKNN